MAFVARLSLVVAVSIAIQAFAADDYTWSGGNGDWSDSGKWTITGSNPAVNGVPGADDTARVSNGIITLTQSGTQVHTLVANGGTITGTGGLNIIQLLGTGVSFDGTGILAINGGSINGFTTRRRTDLFNTIVLLGAGITGRGEDVVNHGTLELRGQTELRGADGATFINLGTIICANNISNTGGFVNKISSPGTIHVTSGHLAINCLNSTIELSGPIHVDAGCKLSLQSSGSLTIANTSSISGDGDVVFTPNGVIEINAPYLVNGITTIATSSGAAAPVNFNLDTTFSGLELSQGRIGGSGDIVVPSNFSVTGGRVEGAGALEFGSGVIAIVRNLTIDKPTTLKGTFNLQSNFTIREQFTNDGIVNVGGDISVSISGSNGSFNNNGTYKKSSGTIGGTGGTFINRGLFIVSSCSLSIGSGFVQDGGDIEIDNGVISGTTLDLPSGRLLGTGTISANFTNSGGHIYPGGIGALGTIHISGNYTQGAAGSLEIDIGGLNAGQFDTLTIAAGKVAALGGTIKPVLINGFAPVANDKVDCVTFGSRSGVFSSVGPSNPTFGATYTASTASLTAENPIAILDSISPTSKFVNDAAFTLTLAGSDFVGGAVVTFQGQPSLTPDTLSATQITVTVPAGYLAASGNYNISVVNQGSGPSASQVLTVSKRSQTITFSTLAAKVFGDADFSGGATASSLLTVSYASDNTSVAAIVGGLIHIVGAGTATITASQAGNAEFLAATSQQQILNVSQTGQTITFNSLAPRKLSDPDFDAGANASSALTISYSSSDTNVATIVSGMIHLVGVGTTTITASQPGNANVMAAASVQQVLSVNKGDQTITFGPLPTKVPEDAEFTPGASVNSGLPISYSSSDTSVAAIVGGKIHVVGTGSTTITASQSGDASWNAATSVQQSLTVKQSQTITFPFLPSKTLGDADFEPGATASSGLAVSYSSSNTSVATIVSGKIHLVGAGTATITASQPGNTTFIAAVPVQQALSVLAPPPGNPVPSLGAISPGSVKAGSGAFTVTLSGENFVTGALVGWQGKFNLTPTTVSQNQISVTVPTEYIADAGGIAITVLNPLPGGGVSNALTFTVTGGGSAVPGGALAPRFDSPPSAAPNPALTGQVVTFSAAAADGNGDVLAYTWDFGDGSTGMGASVSHTYTVAGVYTASVVVTDGTATDKAVVNVAINADNNTKNGSVVFGIQKASMKFNFKTRVGKDSLALGGTIPVEVGFQPSGATVVLAMGNLEREFVLNPKGQSLDKAFKLSGKLKNSAFAVAGGKFVVSIKNATLFELLKEEGFFDISGTDTVDLPIILSVNDQAYLDIVSFAYKAIAGKSGSAKK